MTEKRKGRQPQVFTGTSAIFSLTTEPRVDWVKGNHRRYGIGWGRIRKIFERQAKKPRLHQEGNREPATEGC